MTEFAKLSHSLLISTFPDRKSAEEMAGRLLEKRLVACVQLSEIDSFYHWQNEVVSDREIKFTAKTCNEHIATLRSEINTHHPYEVPQFVVLPITSVSKQYLAWMQAEILRCPPKP